MEIRVDAGEKAAYDQAAELLGMERSDWIRKVLNEAVKRVSQKKRGPAGS